MHETWPNRPRETIPPPKPDVEKFAQRVYDYFTMNYDDWCVKHHINDLDSGRADIRRDCLALGARRPLTEAERQEKIQALIQRRKDYRSVSAEEYKHRYPDYKNNGLCEVDSLSEIKYILDQLIELVKS